MTDTPTREEAIMARAKAIGDRIKAKWPNLQADVEKARIRRAIDEPSLAELEARWARGDRLSPTMFDRLRMLRADAKLAAEKAADAARVEADLAARERARRPKYFTRVVRP